MTNNITKNSYERYLLYTKYELEGIPFTKNKIKEYRWICITHHKMCVPVNNPWCENLCCLKCPVDECNNENFQQASLPPTGDKPEGFVTGQVKLKTVIT